MLFLDTPTVNDLSEQTYTDIKTELSRPFLQEQKTVSSQWSGKGMPELTFARGQGVCQKAEGNRVLCSGSNLVDHSAEDKVGICDYPISRLLQF